MQELQDLLEGWRDAFGFAPPQTHSNFQLQPASLDMLFGQGTNPILVLDYRDFSFPYVSPNISWFLGVDPGLLNQNGLSALVAHFDPDYLTNYSGLFNRDIKRVLKSFPSDRRRDLKISYTYRLRRNGGEYFSCLHETYFLELDPEGRPIIGMNQLTDLQHINHHPVFSFGVYLREPDGVYHPGYLRFYPREIPDGVQFSGRELQVMTLIAQGASTPETADRLGITVNTIYTHRRRLLKRLEKYTMTELISYVVNQGIIDPSQEL